MRFGVDSVEPDLFNKRCPELVINGVHERQPVGFVMALRFVGGARSGSRRSNADWNDLPPKGVTEGLIETGWSIFCGNHLWLDCGRVGNRCIRAGDDILGGRERALVILGRSFSLLVNGGRVTSISGKTQRQCR